MTVLKKASVYMFAITLLILVSLSPAHTSSPNVTDARTINIPNNYPTIQAAIDAAIAGDTILVASGTYYENVVINKPLALKGAGNDITLIDGSGRGTGVRITADNVNISGFTIRNSGDGVHLYICSGVTVRDNKITLNRNDGIYVQSASDNTIRGNTITSNDLGGLSIQSASDNTISDNVIASNAHEGVYLYDSSNNNTVSGNTITSHINWPAISLEVSNDNTISNNTMVSNNLGISLYGSINNTVVGNTVSNNDYVGISLYQSGGNTFYHNNFNNTEQVYPSGTNAWDNDTEGNYWSDYNGTGPYDIDDYNQDRYPLINPYDETKPVADAGPDQLVVNGTTVTFDGSESTDNLGIANYTWTFTDNTAQVLTGVKANYTFGNIANFSVTLNVSDHSGNWDTDKMWVNVTMTKLIRDVAVTHITAFPTTVTTGDFLFINVTVANKGNMSETFNLTVYYDSSVVGTKNGISLAPGDDKTLTFNWSTIGVPGGNYTIKAVASIVAGETHTEDNEGTGDNKVTIRRLSSTISISVFPQTIVLGNSTTINGSISPQRVEVNVTINYSLSGENWSKLENVTTGTDGSYSYEWTPNTAGSYEVKASWLGDATTLPAESYGRNVTVEEAEEPPPEDEPPTDIYLYAAAIAAIIIVSATAVYVLRVRKPKPAQ